MNISVCNDLLWTQFNFYIILDYRRILVPKNWCLWSLGRFYWVFLYCLWVWRTPCIAEISGITTNDNFIQVTTLLLIVTRSLLNSLIYIYRTYWLMVSNLSFCHLLWLISMFIGLNHPTNGCWLRHYRIKMKWYISPLLVVAYDLSSS